MDMHLTRHSVVGDEVDIVARALEAEVVEVAGLRLRPTTDEQMAIGVIAALSEAGYDIVRRGGR